MAQDHYNLMFFVQRIYPKSPPILSYRITLPQAKTYTIQFVTNELHPRSFKWLSQQVRKLTSKRHLL